MPSNCGDPQGGAAETLDYSGSAFRTFSSAQRLGRPSNTEIVQPIAQALHHSFSPTD